MVVTYAMYSCCVWHQMYVAVKIILFVTFQLSAQFVASLQKLSIRSFHCQILPALLRVPSCAQVTLKNFLNKHSVRAIILTSVYEFIIPIHVKTKQADILIMNFSRF